MLGIVVIVLLAAAAYLLARAVLTRRRAARGELLCVVRGPGVGSSRWLRAVVDIGPGRLRLLPLARGGFGQPVGAGHDIAVAAVRDTGRTVGWAAIWVANPMLRVVEVTAVDGGAVQVGVPAVAVPVLQRLAGGDGPDA